MKGHRANRDMIRDRKRRLRGFLDVSQVDENNMPDFDEPRTEGSCEWILDKQMFGSWRDDSGPSMLAIFAAPAMGKSYLADFVQEHLKSLGCLCSSFFFQADDSSRSSLSKCLLHLAFDMACQIPSVGNSFLEMQNDDISIERYSEKPHLLWRKLFVDCVFKQELHRPYFWIIDAVDECKRHEDLYALLTGTSHSFPIRILLTSRPSRFLEEKILQADIPTSSLSIMPQDNRQDIERYVRSNLRAFEKDRTADGQQVISSILKKSEGCFLWVKLVVSELKKAQSTKLVRKVLEGMPDGMDRLYGRAVKTLLSVSSYIRSITISILRWALHSVRPLTIKELHEALKLDLDDEVPDLENQVCSLTENLLFVDSQSRVRLIHQTVRSFLVQESATRGLGLDEARSHRRIASVCLRHLCLAKLRAPAARRSSHQRPFRSDFIDYAAMFYEHIRHCSASDEEIFDQLATFFQHEHGNVLVWIEHIASGKDLGHLSRTGMVLNLYLRRRVKHFPLIGKGAKALEGWSVDLIRLAAKFGHNLLRAPGSILNIIPPLCPTDSAIFRLYGTRNPQLTVAGLASTVWNDQLASLAFPDEMLYSVACSSDHFVIGSSKKLVRLYQTSTCQSFVSFRLEETPKVLEFNASGQLLLCAGGKRLYVWDMASRDCFMQVSIPSPCIAACFSA